MRRRRHKIIATVAKMAHRHQSPVLGTNFAHHTSKGWGSRLYYGKLFTSFLNKSVDFRFPFETTTDVGYGFQFDSILFLCLGVDAQEDFRS